MLPLLMACYRSPSSGPRNLLFSSLSFCPLNNITQHFVGDGMGYIRVRDEVSGLRLLMVALGRMLMMVMFMRLLVVVRVVLVMIVVRLRGWWRRMMICIMCGSTLMERWLAGRNNVCGCFWTEFAFDKVLDDLGDLVLILALGPVGWREWRGLCLTSVSVLRPVKVTSKTYRLSVVAVVHGPPPTKHLVVWRAAGGCFSTQSPRLIASNEVDHVNARLEVAVGGNVLVVAGGRDVVGEAKSVVAVLEVHVQQALVCAVKRYAPLGHGHQGIIVAQVWRQGHNSRVEEIGPSNIRGGGKGVVQVKELVGCPVSDDIGIYVHDPSELGLFPQIDLCECRVQVGTIHQVEVRRLLVSYAGNWYHMVEDGLATLSKQKFATNTTLLQGTDTP